MKIVHASDLHLDSPLRGLPRYAEAPVDAFRGATRRALARLVALCLEERASLLVIAGDLVDASGRDYKTGLFLVKELLRLGDQATQVVLVRGNHDAASRWFGKLLFPDHVVELGLGGPETLVLESLGLAVHGWSYRERAARANLARGYPLPLTGFLNVGVLHTSAEGRKGHDPYAPCTARELRAHGYDYWALGHVHGSEVLGRSPWVVFPGNLQGRSMRESGPKGAVLITAREGRVTEVEHRPLDVARFGVCPVEVGGIHSLDQAAERAHGVLLERAAELGDRALAVRFVLRGTSGIGRLLSYAPPARSEAFRRAAGAVRSPPVWVEGVWADLDGEFGGAWPLDPPGQS
jgi:DNA repair exonuclease SbcCD nuclease subunit